MVTLITGFLSMFKDLGPAVALVQKEQVTTLFCALLRRMIPVVALSPRSSPAAIAPIPYGREVWSGTPLAARRLCAQ
jgi:hypothetical protein